MVARSDVLDAVVVGAGFAGIGMGIKLDAAGRSRFVILEQGERVGGTWRDNSYPGCACDVPAHLYSFSFEPNPDWTLPYAPQAEILAYLARCVEKYGLTDRVRLGTAATRAAFDEQLGLWTVRTSAGDELRARALVLGTGPLNRWSMPDIPGLDRFAGPKFHSSAWDHSVALEGKTVAVIGTGASAIQIVPAIAPITRKLHVFQRTPAWIMPKLNGVIDERARARFARHPALQVALRKGIYGLTEVFGLGFTHARPVMRLAELGARKYLAASVRDPELRRKLTPRYAMGAKRVLFSNDFYPAIQRDDVELVTDGIAEVRERSIVGHDGREREVDAIVLATGFDAAQIKVPFEIVGRHGRAMPDGADAYLGTTFAGFPNLFMIVGPNTGLGHTSMVVMMEAQIGYILGALRAMNQKKLRMIDVREDVQRRYNDRIQARLAKSVWNTGGTKSWYLDERGKNTTLWPGLTIEYRARMARFDLESYEVARETLPVA
jgi:cation diffusion facilitator CzcD-associated flavoprotein CzcO